MEPIVDIAKLFAQGRLPKGNSVGVLSISGGSGIVYADAAVRGGMTLPPFSERTMAALRKIVPSFGSPENPADVTAGFFNDMSLFTDALEIVLADPGLDQLSILLASVSGPRARPRAAKRSPRSRSRHGQARASWPGRAGTRKSAEAVKALPRRPRARSSPRRCGWRARRRCWRGSPPTSAACCRARTPEAGVPKGSTLPAGAVTLNEAESKAVLRAFGMPVAKEVFVPPAPTSAAAANRA